MATERFANNPVSTLASGISDLDLSLMVASAASFPTQPQFRLLIEAEILLVTGVVGPTFTVSRGQEGTTAAPHLAGTPVRGILTAGAMEQLKSDVPLHLWLACVSGVQSAGTPYTVIGSLPALTYSDIGATSFTLKALINIPSGSTARVRLYDSSNANTLWESAVIAGPQTEYAISQAVTPAAGASLLEFWLATPTDTGGNASCLTAGILAAR